GLDGVIALGSRALPDHGAGGWDQCHPRQEIGSDSYSAIWRHSGALFLLRSDTSLPRLLRQPALTGNRRPETSSCQPSLRAGAHWTRLCAGPARGWNRSSNRNVANAWTSGPHDHLRSILRGQSG